MDNWCRQLEVYCRIQNLQEDDIKIQWASLRMEGATLVWWEARTQDKIKKHGKISISCSDFIASIKRKFYPLAHMQKAIMNWKNFKQLRGQNLQEYNQAFRKRALMLGVDLQSQDTLLKYIGGFQDYLRHTILMFSPTNLDEVYVQDTHLEARGKNIQEEGKKNPFQSVGKRKFKGKKKKCFY